MDGASVRMYLRPGPLLRETPHLRAFRRKVNIATVTATAASISQTVNHPSGEACNAAIQAASSEVIPTTNIPHPGTAVKEADRSITSRMKRKCSLACSSEEVLRCDMGPFPICMSQYTTKSSLCCKVL